MARGNASHLTIFPRISLSDQTFLRSPCRSNFHFLLFSSNDVMKCNIYLFSSFFPRKIETGRGKLLTKFKKNIRKQRQVYINLDKINY